MMAIRSPLPATPLLTYEDYLTEGYVEGSYDIVEGVRKFMPGATWEHQEIVVNIIAMLRDYQIASGSGKVLTAPFDVLIRRVPRLQVRQPDVLFISHAQLAAGGGVPKKGPLEVAPELVVEVISDSETQRRVEDKIRDYVAIGVKECWRVWPETRTVEALRLTAKGADTVHTYDETQALQSLAFPDLTLFVAAIFAA
jgi:Uma2 family endonuclease